MQAMEKPPSKTRIQLDRQAWIAEATDVLADEGVGGLRVEVLAKRLKVTKGSFYWHFQDRGDLLQAVLAHWREGRIQDVVRQAPPQPGGAASQIRHLIERYGTGRSRRGMLIELAVREWAQRDPAAAAIVREVDSRRLALTRDLFLAAGLSEREAASRGVLLYAYVFGLSLMMWEDFDADRPQLGRDLAELVAGFPLPPQDPA
jgi:AcrR family transcriptional regulator